MDDVDKKRGNKPLWKHIQEKHGGVMSVPMFSHFKMEVVQFFASAQRRKADEGVRIAHLDPDTRMNSKDEFIFGACSRSGIVKCSVGEEKVAAEGLMQPVLLPMWSNPANIKLDKIILATTIIFNHKLPSLKEGRIYVFFSS